MATSYSSPTDWGFQWDTNLALNDTAPLVGTGSTVYNWLGNNYKYSGLTPESYNQAIWDWYRGTGHTSPYDKPTDWQKLDFNIAYNRYWRDKIKAQEEAVAANPDASLTGAVADQGAAPTNPVNWTTGGPGPVDIDGVHYDYATWKVYDDGRIELIKDYSQMLTDVKNLPDYFKEQGLTSFADWQDKTKNYTTDVNDYLAALQTIADQLQAGNLQSDLDAANEWAASGMGITATDYANMMADLTTQVNMDASAQQGLSPEEMALRERLQRNESRRLQSSFQKMLDNALGSSNSRSRYLMQGDQYLSQMRDQELQYSFSIMEEDAARRQQNYENKFRTWSTMFQQNQMGTQQFLDNIRQNRSMEMQVIAAQASTVLQQNQQYLQEYTADLNAANFYIQAKFDSITTQLGMDTAIYDQLADMYAVALAPWQADMTEWTANKAAYDAQQALIATYAQSSATTQAASDNFLSSLINGGLQLLMVPLNLLFGKLINTPAPGASGTASATGNGYPNTLPNYNVNYDPNYSGTNALS